MGLSLSHLIIILVIVLVLFGAGKLPQMMSDMGKGMKAFKDGVKDETEGKEIKPKGLTKSPVKASAKAKTTTKTATTKGKASTKITTKPKAVVKKPQVKKASEATKIKVKQKA